MLYKYEWNRCVKSSVAAEIVGQKFEEIEKRDGMITRENVLDSARDKNSELHSLFEWDDEIAGEKYRLSQAHYYISNLIRVELATKGQRETKPTRAFVNISTNQVSGGRFVNIYHALKNEETRQVVLQRAMNELASFRKKYENLSELADVLAAIDSTLDRKAG